VSRAHHVLVLFRYAEKLLNGGFQNPRAGQHDDQAHPPITPCKAVDPNTIQDRHQREVYTLVVKHYLACCSRDAQGKETSITVRMGTEEFTATGLMILEKNWLEIYDPWERWSTGQGQLPPVQVGSRVVPSSLLMKEGRTTPPQPISEVELIALMDRNAIGTDATIAQHISTIQDREYATKDASQRFSPTPLGIALVEGYNQMGYQLNKPDLRREMEHECNLVANQQKTKDDIIGPILEKMRLCFLTATAEAHKLDEAVGRHFPRLGANNTNMQVQIANFSTCGVCQNAMSLKSEGRTAGRGGDGGNGRRIIFCTTCQEGWTVPRGALRPKTSPDNGGRNPIRCPICSYQVVDVERGEGYEGNGYHFCPKCFNDAPEAHGGNPNSGNFRCFNCTHPTCELAGGIRGGEVEVFPCPFCREQSQHGKIVLRKNSRGFVLSCSNFSSGNKCGYTIWLPRESQEVSVPEGDANVCTQCVQLGTVRKVCFKWKPGSVPPHLGHDCTVCLLCDVSFRQDMQVSLPQRGQVGRNNSQPSRRGGRSASGGRGPGGRGGRGNGSRAQVAPINAGGYNRSGGGEGGNNVCYRCNQAGHYANACPTRNQ
jgi:DNA topoisomerase III